MNTHVGSTLPPSLPPLPLHRLHWGIFACCVEAAVGLNGTQFIITGRVEHAIFRVATVALIRTGGREGRRS